VVSSRVPPRYTRYPTTPRSSVAAVQTSFGVKPVTLAVRPPGAPGGVVSTGLASGAVTFTAALGSEALPEVSVASTA
jgi:hypothetical protein